MWPPSARLRVVPVALALVLAACSSGGPAATVDRADAVRLVLAENARFTGLVERDPNLIGQSSWWEVSRIADGWQVIARIGWGDCEAGCIHEHRWTYSVAGDTPRLESETGSALPGSPGISGVATSGPTCPVVTDPPQAGCEEQPVPGAAIAIRFVGGGEVARVTTDAAGRFSLVLAPGAYRVEPLAVPGLMGTAAPLDVRVEADEPMVEITLGYDTGIR